MFLPLIAAATPTRFGTDFSLPSLLTLLLLFLFAFFAVWTGRRAFKHRSMQGAWLQLGLAVAALAGCITQAILSGHGMRLLSPFALLFLLGALVLSFLIQTFRKTLGTLTVVLVVAALLLAFLFLRSLAAFTGSTLIATIHVLEKAEQTMTLRVTPEKEGGPEYPSLMRLKGDRFALIVYQVVFNDLAVFFGVKTRYAWLGMTAFDSGFKQTDLKLFPDFLQRKAVLEAMEKNEVRLPFVKSVQASMDSKLAFPGRAYQVFVENDGGVTIRPFKAQNRDLTNRQAEQ